VDGPDREFVGRCMEIHSCQRGEIDDYWFLTRERERERDTEGRKIVMECFGILWNSIWCNKGLLSNGNTTPATVVVDWILDQCDNDSSPTATKPGGGDCYRMKN
jgi:hypothetical protein